MEFFADSEVSKVETVSTPSPSNNEIDELDKFLSGYKAPMDIPVQQAGSIPINQPAQSTPFITHNPQGSQPKIEYFQRGAKKGQPKPPKKPGSVGYVAPMPQAIQASVFLTGAMLLLMVDLLFPLAIVTIHNWKSKVKIDGAKMKMSEQQKRDLAPVGDAVVKELNINANPTLLLLIGLGGIYATNYMAVRNQAVADDLKKQKEVEKTKNPYT